MSIKLILCIVIGVFTSGLSETLKRSAVLDNQGKFSVNWEANLETETVVFTLDVETTGFVGFGISMNPNMAGADIVIAGVKDDQTFYFGDYHAPSNGFPQLDESQDWELINASESDGHTHLQFSRKLNTCDDDGDVAIKTDTQYLIWAIGDTDEIRYHGADPNKRSAKIINLLDAPSPNVDLSQLEVYQIRRNHSLEAQDTSYWCTIHKAPDFNGTKHHIVAFNTTIESEKSLKHSHHVVIYHCVPPEGQSSDYFEQFVGHPGSECHSESPEIPTHYCRLILFIWAVGGEMLILPEMTGYPIGEIDRQEYLMFEIHVDNPDLETGTFETGMDIFYTSNLREMDAAVFVVSHDVNHLQIIPPRSTDFVNIAHCSSECTAALVPPEGMTLINVMFHAHKAGKRMKTRIIRNGIELPWLAVDDHYDFNYQANRPFQEYRKILPGDHIITECTYDTAARPNVTIGGFPSMYEMCQAFFWHYPKGLIHCDSTALPDLKDLFGIESLDASVYYKDPILTKPDSIAGMRYSDYLNSLDWTDDLKSRLQHQLRYGPHRRGCDDAVVPYPEIKQEYVEESACNNSSGNFEQATTLSLFVVLVVKTVNYF